MDKMQDLTALLKHEIEDLISAEDQIIGAMPLMIENAKSNTLKKALRQHLKVTQAQRKRLDKVQKLMGVKKGEASQSTGFLSSLFGGITQHECKGMKGIIEEGNKIMAEDMVDTVKDAAIIASAQKVEHYEICGYGTARSYANELNLTDVAKLLEETLNEEYEADKLLTTIAEGDVNVKAEGKKPASKGTNGSGSSVTAKKAASTQGSAKKTAATPKKAASKSTTATAKKAANKTSKK
ncbi:ferritin-like domain-containing protein [Aridibaculum aurantiacum]|uniref:YciE/YciF ferroxidase family protein n=1 Tax=Aridibaculum aurantiacum TaxID=2810307 RepID=UPI001A958DE3|nr:DUF892 family protein [Aridibaculum aurantiacum]